eukprot:Colp12_sorted_trinity150504_noHs@24102
MKGEVERNKFLRMAKYSQHVVDELNLDCSAVQFIADRFPEMEKEDGKPKSELIRAHLGKFGLSGDLALKPVNQLSGGQKARLWYAYVSWRNPHILLLDEPTNHLDMESIDALIDAMKEFKGGLVCVSHDTYLISALCDEIWLCGRDQTVTEYEGSFEDYKKQLIKQMHDNALVLDFQNVKL